MSSSEIDEENFVNSVSSDEEDYNTSSSEEEDSLDFADLKQIRKIDTSEDVKRNDEEIIDIMPKKKRSKSEPPELSAKIRVGPFKAKIHNFKKRPEPRDPRFDSLSGEFNPTLFRRSYGFINEIRMKEIEKLKKQISKEKDEDEKERLRKALNILQSKVALEKREEQIQQIKSKHRKEQIERIKQGKNPYFLSKRKLNELAKSNTSEKNRKKRKRNKKEKNAPFRERRIAN